MIEQQLLMSDQASAARLRAIADEAAIQIQRLMRAGRLMEAEHLAGDAQALLAGAAALEQLATLEAEAKWQSIDTLPDHETALTIHACDLFPVVAFRVREVSGVVTWLSEVEGPEDDATRPGAYRALSRHPTHWKPLDWPVAHDERACGRCTPAPDTTPGDDDAR